MENGHLNGLDAPIEVFKARIGDSDYEFRWSFHAEYILSLRGMTLGEILNANSSKDKRFGALAMELMSACVAHQFPSGAGPTAEELSRRVGPKQFAPAWDACIKAGRAAGAIVDLPKNGQALELKEPAQTAPTA